MRLLHKIGVALRNLFIVVASAILYPLAAWRRRHTEAMLDRCCPDKPTPPPPMPVSMRCTNATAPPSPAELNARVEALLAPDGDVRDDVADATVDKMIADWARAQETEKTTNR